MPNTLAHIGVQTPLTKFGIKTAPLQWIALGCIIPDIPWIVQRIIGFTSWVDPISLRMYVLIQASLFYCCILSLIFSLLTRKSVFIFLILAGNSILHLLLDACQTKWGNGINILLPFSWQTSNFGFFWPEHAASYLLTFMGAAVFFFYWSKEAKRDLLLQKPRRIKTVFLALSCVFYFVSPALFIQTAYQADIHYSKTLSDKKNQPGKEIEIDRGWYDKNSKTLRCYAEDTLAVNNPPAMESGTLSIRGIFDDNNRVTITEYHRHKSHRDLGSYAGLLLTLFLWFHSIVRLQKTTATNRNPS